MMADEVVLPIPNLTIPCSPIPHLKTCTTMHGKISWRVSKRIVHLLLFTFTDSDLTGGWNTEMGPYYKSIISASNILPLDKALLSEMERANEEELKKLENGWQRRRRSKGSRIYQMR